HTSYTYASTRFHSLVLQQTSTLFIIPRPPSSTLFPYTTLFRSLDSEPPITVRQQPLNGSRGSHPSICNTGTGLRIFRSGELAARDRKSTRLNSSHVAISYAVFCLKKKKINF